MRFPVVHRRTPEVISEEVEPGGRPHDVRVAHDGGYIVVDKVSTQAVEVDEH